jgi:hypothetical protein
LSAVRKSSTSITSQSGLMARMQLGHHLRLETADRALHGVDLAIGVGDADVIHVDQSDLLIPARASASAAQEPTPPIPTTQIFAWLKERSAL